MCRTIVDTDDGGRRLKDLDVRVVCVDGELLRHLTLNPSRDNQPPES
jgi:hypothetical protein